MTDILDSLDELDDDDFGLEEDEELEEPSDELEELGDLEDYEMNERQAKEITEAIRSATHALYILIAEAYKHKAHKALGYSTWADYVKDEFDISASRSYQLINLNNTIEMIEEALPEGTEIKLTEAQARDIKRELPRITEQLREETQELDPEEAAARAAALIEEQRAEINQQKKEEEKVQEKKKKDAEEAEKEAYQANLEAEADALLEADRPEGMTDSADDGLFEIDVEGDDSDDTISPEVSMHLYNFFNMLANVASFPAPEDFLAMVPNARAEEINNQLLEATAWLNRFQTLWELRED